MRRSAERCHKLLRGVDMKIILLGAPGAGKGTLAGQLTEEYGFPHISTGDIFRANIKNETPIGLLAKSYIDKGQLVPDEVTCKIVEERLKEEDCKKSGFMLDGFPRTIPQAEMLDSIETVDAVINIQADTELLMKRICGRRVCKGCGKIFHISRLGGKENCLSCGGELYQRKDDNPETVESRLQVYAAQTAPLIEYYEGKGLLINVAGNGTPDEAFEDAKVKLAALKE